MKIDYRIPRKKKKADKAKLVRLTNEDLLAAGLKLVNMKNFKFNMWIMAGVVYPKYHFVA